MRTISRHRPQKSPPGDIVCLCSYCGVAWYRSQLIRDMAGNLACPDELPGRDVVTLALGNAELAATRKLGRYISSDAAGTLEAPNTVLAPPTIYPDGRKATF